MQNCNRTENFVHQALVQSCYGGGPSHVNLDEVSRLETGRKLGNAARDLFIAAETGAQVAGERAEIGGEIR